MDLSPLSETITNASVQNHPSNMVWRILEPKQDSQFDPFDGLLIERTLANTGPLVEPHSPPQKNRTSYTDRHVQCC